MNIRSDETKLWFCDPALFETIELLEQCNSLLSTEEIKRRNRFYFEKDRKLFTISHAFLRVVLGLYLNCPPANITFETNFYGKPYLIPEEENNKIKFNLSHTENLICCAFTYSEAIGCDVEFTDRLQNIDTLGQYFFSSLEKSVLASIPSQKKHNEHFFKLWTRKESYIKAVGKGLSISLDRFGFQFCSDTGRIIFQPELVEKTQNWHFWLLQPTDKHIAAVCQSIPVKDEKAAIKCYWFTQEFLGKEFTSPVIAVSS